MKRAQPSFRFYRWAHRISRALLSIFFRFEFRGRERIPAGAAMICSNHSSLIDPLLLAYAFGVGCYIHFLAKKELFETPVVSFVVIKLGAISVNRDMMDVSAIKRTLEYFKNGEKVGIFPEGTRVSEAEHVAAKNGAVKIADRAEVPLIPVFIPRRKKFFSKLSVVIGEPYYIESNGGKRSSEEYSQLAEALMGKIEALGSNSNSTGAGFS